MSSESEAISVAHMCLHLPHVQVITVRLLTTRMQPSWSHFGHLIGRGQLVFGDTGETGPNYGSVSFGASTTLGHALRKPAATRDVRVRERACADAEEAGREETRVRFGSRSFGGPAAVAGGTPDVQPRRRAVLNHGDGLLTSAPEACVRRI
jgi:hypothetical protein